MKVVLLAGGFATRLWPLTEKTAKPLLEIAGKPIISHILEKLPPDIPVIVSTNAVFADDFEKWKTQMSGNKKRKITIFIEDSRGEEVKKGALAAISLVLKTFGMDDDILVLAGDNLFFFDFQKFLKSAKKNPLLAAYNVKDLSEAKKFGVIVPKKNGTVKEFQEKPKEPKSTLISTGCLYFPKRLLQEVTEYSRENNDNLGGVFEHFLSIGETVEYFSFREKWFDIGSFPEFLEAQKYLIGENVVNAGAQVLGKNTFSGSVYLSKNSHIEDALLENVVIQEGAVIRSASIRNSVIGKNAVVTGVDISGIPLREESFVASE